MTMKLKITTKWTLKMSKHGMVSSFHPHSMCKRVERVTAKTGCTSCTNWTISFGVSGFRPRTHLLHWHFIFFNLLQLRTFLRSVHTIQRHIINLQPFLTSLLFFMHLLIVLSHKTMKLKSIWNELWRGSKLAWYHHFTHIAWARK